MGKSKVKICDRLVDAVAVVPSDLRNSRRFPRYRPTGSRASTCAVAQQPVKARSQGTVLLVSQQPEGVIQIREEPAVPWVHVESGDMGLRG